MNDLGHGRPRPAHKRAASTAASIRRQRDVRNQPRKRLAVSFFLFGVLICALFNFVGVAASADLVGQDAPPAVVLFAYTFPSIYVRLFVPYMPQVLPRWLSFAYLARRFLPGFMYSAIGYEDVDSDDEDEPEADEILGGGSSNVDYPRRLFICFGTSMLGLQLLAWTGPISLRIIGILCVSVASNLGEMTFLQLSTVYPTNVALGAFSSGTGASGLLSAAIYNALTSWLKINVSVVISCVGIVPILILLVYFFILPSGSRFAGKFYNERRPKSELQRRASERVRSVYNKRAANRKENPLVIPALPVMDKLRLVKGLMIPYMIPLFSSFFFIYFANQGLLPDLIFPVPIPESYALSRLFRKIFTQLRSFYPAYQLIYMFGAFIGRSSTNVVRLPPATAWMYTPVGMGIVFFLALLWEALSMTKDGDAFGLLVTILIVLFGGLSEGICYSNSYWRISREDLPESLEETYEELASRQNERRKLIASDRDDYFGQVADEKGEEAADPEVLLREFLISSLAISDVFGILLASVAAAGLTPAVCRVQVGHGRKLCRER